MIDKSIFFKHLSEFGEKTDKLYSYYISSIKNDRFVVTNEFYTYGICKVLEVLFLKYGFDFSYYGFGSDTERNLICFGKADSCIYSNYAKLIKISYNDKFAKLTHKDFLGSIMSLGLEREKLGDLVVEGNCAYVSVVINFTEYIIENLKKVRNVSVNVSVSLVDELPQKKIEVLCKVVSSLRIDSIVSVLTNLSREKAKSVIKLKKVKLNNILEIEIDRKVSENDIIVISGYGKFKLRDCLGVTSKNKIRVTIDKFI